MAKEKEEFNLVNLPPECQDKDITKDDFKLVQVDETIHDQKFETKPTTFLKDCIRRFRKNKSSVVAAFILGILLVMSVLVPIIFKTSDVHDTSVSHPELYYLQPKLFDSGTGFWDGTKRMEDIAVDTKKDPSEWGPDSERYNLNAIVPGTLEIGEEQYTSTPNEYAFGGYIQFGYFNNIPDSKEYETISYSTNPTILEMDFDYSLKVKNFVTFDLAKLQASNEETKTFPEGYVEAESALFFTFSAGTESFDIQLTDFKKAHDVGGADEVIDVKARFEEFVDEYNSDPEHSESLLNSKIESPFFSIRVKNAKNHHNSCTLIRSITFESSYGPDDETKKFDQFSFKDGNEVYNRFDKDLGIWKNVSNTRYCKLTHYLVRAVLCSFVYDTYEAVLGETEKELFYNTQIIPLKQKGIIDFYIGIKTVDGKKVVDPLTTYCRIIDEKKCPLSEEFKAEDVILDEYGTVSKIKCKVLIYKMDPYNLESMPRFLLGTDKTGRDMFIFVFEGLRTSLLLGIITSAVCFLFGLAYGAISGYFGGTVDLIMERFTDILSGVPWIVVMTLAIIHLGSEFYTFAIALCLTGWIGTAATTRTQFYRFRGREYVLASRTLGASDVRLIAKHILPNAMGTIITSAVLMVPSVIFSEATISYLGLGFKNLASLGVILSDNQVELTNHPYLLIFPAVVIALLMISFNLFGNGLRDAVNPSLKGEGE